MNLKEAFRYQNFLDQKISAMSMYLSARGNVVRVLQLHKRNEANPDAENEEVDATNERPYGFNARAFADSLMVLLREKELCAQAITVAKEKYANEHGFDLDAQLSVNKLRQSVARTFSALGGYKETKRISAGTGYKFNAEGVQAPYRYDIEEKTTPDFDVSLMKQYSKNLTVFAESASADADRCMIESELDFVPLFSPTDSIEDVLGKVTDENLIESVCPAV